MRRPKRACRRVRRRSEERETVRLSEYDEQHQPSDAPTPARQQFRQLTDKSRFGFRSRRDRPAAIRNNDELTKFTTT